MKSETVDRRKLTAYLLGTLPEAEQDAIAEAHLTDAGVFEQLLEVENDLIDDYVRGRLTAVERRQFEGYLNSLPDGWHKVAVARALIEVVAEESATTAPPADEPADGKWSLRAWLKSRALVPATAVALLLCGAGLIYLLRGNRELRQANQQLSQANEQLRAESGQRAAQDEQLRREAQEMARRLAAEQQRAAASESELERERRRAKQLRASAGTGSAPLPLITWPLAANTLRDPAAAPGEVKLKAGARTVALTIPVTRAERYVGYEVVLQTRDGRERLWQERLPRTPPPRRGSEIVLHRPAGQFTAGSYKLTLTLKRADGTHTTHDYYFTVVGQ
jgi:hypothetical protein